MYVDVPTKVSAIEFTSSPDTPKSQILICPDELQRMFEGLISAVLIVNRLETRKYLFEANLDE